MVRLPRPKSPPARPMPERLAPAEVEVLLRWAMERGYTMEETSYATQRVRDWARQRPREPQKRDWVRAIQNALRDGWALRGLKEELERRGRLQRTPITDAWIEAMVRRAREGAS